MLLNTSRTPRPRHKLASRARAAVLVAATAIILSSCGSATSKSESAQPNATANSKESTTSAASGPAAPDASPYVVAFGDLTGVSFPNGDPGFVSIIIQGTVIQPDGTVSIVVRNNTSKAVGPIEIAGTARDQSEKVVGSGSSQGMNPAVVAPGEIAFGYVFFDTDLAGTQPSFKFTVSSLPVSSHFRPLLVDEINLVSKKILGSVTNNSEGNVSGPISADVICFGSDGNILRTHSDFVAPYDLPAGATGSFAIDLFSDACPSGLLASSGYGT